MFEEWSQYHLKPTEKRIHEHVKEIQIPQHQSEINVREKQVGVEKLVPSNNDF